jgi:hypothetical protein
MLSPGRLGLLIILVLTTLLFVLCASMAKFGEIRLRQKYLEPLSTKKAFRWRKQHVEPLSLNISSVNWPEYEPLGVNVSSISWREQYVEPLSVVISSATAHQIAVEMLSNRWVYIVGDSSMRMFFRALIHIIEPEFNDPHFGSFIIHEKGGCTNPEDGHAGGGCLREYLDKKTHIRLTYSFKTLAQQKTLALDWLISKAFVPDIIIGATGAWDIYASGKGDAIGTAVWYKEMSEHYSTAQILAITTIACPPHRDVVTTYNTQVTPLLLSMNLPRLAILDRHASTFQVQDKAVCEGFHAYGDLVLMHVHAFLGNLQTSVS